MSTSQNRGYLAKGISVQTLQLLKRPQIEEQLAAINRMAQVSPEELEHRWPRQKSIGLPIEQIVDWIWALSNHQLRGLRTQIGLILGNRALTPETFEKASYPANTYDEVLQATKHCLKDLISSTLTQGERSWQEHKKPLPPGELPRPPNLPMPPRQP